MWWFDSLLWWLLAGDHPKLSWHQFTYISDRLLTPLQAPFKFIQNVIRNLFWFADMTWNQDNQEKVVESFCGCPTVLWVQSSVKASPIWFFTSGRFLHNFFLGLLLGQFLKYIWVFPKMVVPNNHGFPTKNGGYHHLRKHPYCVLCNYVHYNVLCTVRWFSRPKRSQKKRLKKRSF